MNINEYLCLKLTTGRKPMDQIVKYYAHELMNNPTLSNDLKILYQEVIHQYSCHWILD